MPPCIRGNAAPGSRRVYYLLPPVLCQIDRVLKKYMPLRVTRLFFFVFSTDAPSCNFKAAEQGQGGLQKINMPVDIYQRMKLVTFLLWNGEKMQGYLK